MPTAKVQRTDFLEAQEKDGTVVRLVTRSRVIQVTDGSLAALNSALALMPAVGSQPVGFPQLMLRERNPVISEDDPQTVDVDLVYEHYDNPGQSFAAPLTGAVIGSVRAYVQQSESNIDINGRTVEVEHTYPTDDPEKAGKTEKQGGRFEFYQAQRTIHYEGIKTTSRPWLIANQMIGALNSNPWMGQGAREWMCTGVSWGLLTGNSYPMSFEFQHNPDTWDPTVVFIDDRTGRPPKDLVKDTGFKKVFKHPVTNFERVIGVRLQGA